MDPISKLLQYFNEEAAESTYYSLVLFTLQNIKQLSTLSIVEFSEKTFVSKPTITRFIHFMGFENYKSFKLYFQTLSTSSRNSFLRLTAHEAEQIVQQPSEYFSDYAQQVIRSIEDATKTVRSEEVDQIIHSVLAANRVSFVGFSDARHIARDIQLGCLSAGKLVTVPKTTAKFSDIQNTYSSDDLIVILSNYGNFFHVYYEFYQKLIKNHVPVILITQNYSSMDSFDFKQTLYLCSQRHLSVGNYPMRLFSDYFVRRLIFLANHDC
ncbi:MurR/RpiR family transcriptional regulator [Enterococcus camelliae]|uniref:MurR/RpiR family transcriptional regulator n=1 Tax=Enterococcus camelliae TaxID=453959 RepID=A0ABW5TJI7_9ENTE